MTGYSSSSLQIRKHFQNGWRVSLHTQGTERCLIWHGRASVRCMLRCELCELDTKVHMLGSSANSNEGNGEVAVRVHLRAQLDKCSDVWRLQARLLHHV